MIAVCEECKETFEVNREYFRLMMRRLAEGITGPWRCRSCRTWDSIHRQVDLIEQGSAIGEGAIG